MNSSRCDTPVPTIRAVVTPLPDPVEATTTPPPTSFAEVDRRLAEARYRGLTHVHDD
jgi:hypothetical protein